MSVCAFFFVAKCFSLDGHVGMVRGDYQKLISARGLVLHDTTSYQCVLASLPPKMLQNQSTTPYQSVSASSHFALVCEIPVLGAPSLASRGSAAATPSSPIDGCPRNCVSIKLLAVVIDQKHINTIENKSPCECLLSPSILRDSQVHIERETVCNKKSCISG